MTSNSPKAVSANQPDFVKEIRNRVINIERKINILLQDEVKLDPDIMASLVGEDNDRRYGSKTFAQHGDDLIILNIFHMIGIEQPSYIDVGAHDPYKISNTALLYQRGSRGINVEANPALIKAFQTQRPRDINLNVGVAGRPGEMTFHLFSERSGINSFSTEHSDRIEKSTRHRVGKTIQLAVTTIGEILEKHWNGQFPDFLSIDVEGMDLEVLQSIDYAKVAPKVICVEGNTLEARRQIAEYLESKEYTLYFRAVSNLFFLQTQYISKLRS